MLRPPIVWSTLTAALAVTLATPVAGFAQGASVTGTVTDSATGQPIVGANVTVIGSAVGTLTDRSGRYLLIGLPVGSVRLRAQRIGFNPRVVDVTLVADATATVEFSLTPAPTPLSEVVVTGYGTSTRANISGAVSSVSAKEIENTPLAGIDAAIQGRAAGVQVVQNAGNPGVGVTVRIRGSASISASNQPLYVIDGVPLLRDDFSQIGLGGQDLSGVTGINPDEIESIDVLKDAASAAIYGSRGSNGVVMITTKRGRAGAARVTFNAYGGSQNVPKSGRWDLLSGREYVEYMNEAALNDNPTRIADGDPPYPANLFGDPDTIRVNTDWQEEILRTTPITNVTFGLTGGSDRVQYYVSGSNFDQNGVVLGSAYTRQSGRVNVDLTASERLRFRTSLVMSREDHDRIQNDNTIAGVGTNAIANQPHIRAQREGDGSFTTPVDEKLEYENPLAIATYNTAESRLLRAVGSVDAAYTLANSLTLNGRVGMDVLNQRDLRWYSPKVGGSYAESAGGVAVMGNTTANRYVLEGFVGFEPSVADASLAVTTGASVEWNGDELDFVEGENFAHDEFQYPGNAATVVGYDGDWTGHNLVSFFGRANAAYRERYLLTSSLRVDGSSHFGNRNRYGVFPAASVGWKVTNEPFAAGLARMGELKLRVSYGLTGNQHITDDFAPIPRFERANYGDLAGIAKSSFGNPDLKWESTREYNVGFDLVLLDGRVTVLGDWYRKVTEDLLLSRQITSTSGLTTVFENVGNMENRGYELTINTVNLDPPTADGLRWTTDFNISWNRNKVTKLFNGEPFPTGLYSVSRVEEGHPLSAFYTLRFDGVDPATGDAIFFDKNTVDTNGDGIPDAPDGMINADDRVFIGSPHPDYWGGLTNTLSWHGFDLRTFLQFTQGHTIFNAIAVFANDGGYYHDNKFKRVLRRWQQPGDVTDEPRASYDGHSGLAGQISSRYFEDGSYVRLQEVTLGYRLPEPWTAALRLKEARVYVSGRNLHTWTDYSGYSPDVNSNGSNSNTGLATEFYAYPPARTIMVGISGAF